MIERLRESTGELHLELERELIPIIKNVTGSAEYVRLLQLFYGYYYPLEQYIAAHIDTSFPGGFDKRRKALLLLDDIAAITGAPAETPVCCEDIPEIADANQALGAMYVLEGSTLGGQVICQLLLRNLKDPALPGAMSFFNGYGTETQARWDSFVHYLTGYHGDIEQQGKMLKAAADTFLKFRQWVINRK